MSLRSGGRWRTSSGDRLRDDDRGLSELIGYVLAFAVVVASIGIVYTAGLGSIQQYQQTEQERNAERAFVALAESLNDVQRGEAPARNGEIRLAGGTLAVDDGPTVEVAVDAGGGSRTVYAGNVGALEYSLDGARVAYVAGAVLRADRGSAYIVDSPPFSCSDDRAIVSLVTLTEGDASSISTQGSVLVEAEARSTSLRYPDDAAANADADSVTLTFDSDTSAWGRALEDDGWTESGGGDSYTCETDRVVVRRTTIRLDFL